jgi:anti-sigma factor RsiW
MRCSRVQERLVLYLAGELTPRENARLIGHLERCAVCTAQAEELAATQEQVETALRTDLEPPPTLDARVMAAVRALPPRQPSRPGFLTGWGGRQRFAFAAALTCLALLVIVIGRRYTTSELELASLGEAHRHLLIAASDAEVITSDPQQLAQQLSPLFRFPVKPVDLKPEDVRLVGGLRTAVDHVPMAALQYEWQGNRISLFEMDATQRIPSVLQRMRRDPDSYYARKEGDLAYVAWHSGKTDCVMVARAVPMHQLFHFACRACERLESL